MKRLRRSALAKPGLARIFSSDARMDSTEISAAGELVLLASRSLDSAADLMIHQHYRLWLNTPKRLGLFLHFNSNSSGASAARIKYGKTGVSVRHASSSSR